MTTLFPQIKRVDEDETSKIIKNVLFDDQDEMKLEQIFDEFMHLTEESITYSDEDDDDEEDDDNDDDNNIDQDEDGEGNGNSDGANEEEGESNGEDDEDEDDEDDSDSDSDESDSSESEEEEKNHTQPGPPQPTSREPTSWNLDQFIKTIPVTKPQNAKLKPNPVTSPEASNSSAHSSSVASSMEQSEFIGIKTEPPIQITELTPKVKRELEPLPPSIERKFTPESQPTPEPQPTPESVRQANEPVSSPVPQLKKSISQTQPSGSFIVQIDLSKLKRIPTTKAPTPTSCSNSIMTAKALKHEADAEKDKTKQAIKYLESAMYFVLHGYELETSSKNVGYYVDTIPLFRHALKLSMPGSENHDNMTNLKIHTLGLRCLSLLHMKLYKFKERELHENNKVINSQQKSSPIQQADSLLIGIQPQLLSAYKRQLAIFTNLKYANDYWLQADQFCDQHPAVRIFFSTIESNCGSLTMMSQFSKLMDHVKCGLKLLRTS